MANTLHDDFAAVASAKSQLASAVTAATSNIAALASKAVANLKKVAPGGTAGVVNADNSIHLVHVDASAPDGFRCEDVPSLLTTSPPIA